MWQDVCRKFCFSWMYTLSFSCWGFNAAFSLSCKNQWEDRNFTFLEIFTYPPLKLHTTTPNNPNQSQVMHTLPCNLAQLRRLEEIYALNVSLKLGTPGKQVGCHPNKKVWTALYVKCSGPRAFLKNRHCFCSVEKIHTSSSMLSYREGQSRTIAGISDIHEILFDSKTSVYRLYRCCDYTTKERGF